MAKKIIFSTNTSPVADGGLKLSKTIAIEDIEKHPEFEKLFPIKEDVLERITANMKEKGFDGSQPVQIWLSTDTNGVVHNYLIDGYTRYRAAQDAGLKTVPYYGQRFENQDEAMRYALHLQVDRRNLEGIGLLNAIQKLMGSDYIQQHIHEAGGKTSEMIGDIIGTSGRTVARGINVLNNATEEQINQIASGEKTVNQVSNEISDQNLVDNNATEEQLADIENGDKTTQEVAKEIKAAKKQSKKSSKPKKESEDDDFYDDGASDALSDNEGNPAGLNFSHSDGIERPSEPFHKEDDTDRWVKEKNIQVEAAHKDGYEKGYSEGAYDVWSKIVEMLKNGSSTEDIENSDEFSDFTYSEISKKLSDSQNPDINI